METRPGVVHAPPQWAPHPGALGLARALESLGRALEAEAPRAAEDLFSLLDRSCHREGIYWALLWGSAEGTISLERLSLPPSLQESLRLVVGLPRLPVTFPSATLPFLKGVLRTGPPAAVSDLQAALEPLVEPGGLRPLLSRVLDDLGAHCLVAGPLRVGGVVVGALLCAGRDLGEQDLPFLSLLCALVAPAAWETRRDLEAPARERDGAGSGAVVGQHPLTELVATVAHELNNPLSTIRGFVQVLLRDFEPSDPRAEMLGRIEENTGRCMRFIGDLLRQTRRVRAEGGAVDLHTILERALADLGPALAEAGIVVERRWEGRLPAVLANEDQIVEVLANLLRNAIDAMPQGGRLVVSADQAPGAGVHSLARIRIVDEGDGIPPENLPKIFLPFFTTKPLGKGTGLGLTVARRIVEQYGGSLAVESLPGQGTTVTVELPALGGRRGREGRPA